MQITVLNGDDKLQEVNIRPDHLTMVVYGVPGFHIHGQRMQHQCAGDMDEFVASLPNAQNFVKLSWVGDVEHGQFWANATQVREVRAVDDMTKQNYQSAKANVMFIGGSNRVVADSIASTIEQLRAAGAEIPDVDY